MNTVRTSASRMGKAFTLVELLIVISIIAVLAALIFPTVGGINRNRTRTKARTELAAVELAIKNYKDKYGHYPPDNAGSSAQKYFLSPLYFELVGTVNNLKSNNTYRTLDSSVTIAAPLVQSTYGVSGFVNTTRPGSEDAGGARAFVRDLKPGQSAPLNPGGSDMLLTCTLGWPLNLNYPLPSNPGVNPWQYCSTNPTNNPGSFDLWVDILIAGKTNRISNWNKAPQIVN